MRAVPWYAAGLAALLSCAMVQAQEQEPAPAKKSPVPAQSQTQAETPAAGQQLGVSATQKGRGKLFIKESSWDFGYVAQDAKISHEFFIQNVGDDTLFIERIKPT